MGLRNAFRLTRALGAANVVPFPGVASPFAESTNLETIVWSDILAAPDLPMTRATAMKVPAIARARQLVTTTVARLPLTVWRGDQLLTPAPSWCSRTDMDVTPYHRMLWTVDDLFFHGWSLWLARRGAGGALLDVARVPWDWWGPNEDGVICVQAGPNMPRVPARSEEVILIPGSHEGVLTYGADTIRQAIALNETAKDRAENPAAIVELHYTGEKPLSQAEIDAALDHWRKARKQPGGAVGFTGRNIELKTHDVAEAQMLIEARNAAAVDAARITGVNAAMLDATNAGASLTYETTQGRNAEFLDFGVAAYMDPIRERLSADDVVPRGQSVRFDTTEVRTLTPSPTGPVTED